MNEAERLDRNTARLAELYPVFAQRISAVIAELEALGLRPRIQCAWRSPEEQLQAYQSGHSKLRFGFHNVTDAQGKPESLAVDMLDDDSPAQEGSIYLLHLGAAAEAHECTTGIRWGLPTRLRDAIDAAIGAADWNAPVKTGWDPCHVQPADITLAEVKAGKRPLQQNE